MKTLCIYHGNCADGFTSAWIVRKALGTANVEFHAGVYQDPPPDVTGRDVVMVDFSYKAAVIHELASKARTLLILDHHKTAAEDLKNLPPPPSGPYDANGMSSWQQECNAPAALHALFDMERSGAGITWDYFFPDQPRPKLVDHVEDRDLWRFKLPGTREIQAAVFSYPYDFAVWDSLMTTPVNRLADDGEAIERKHHKDIAELTKVVTRPMRFRVPQAIAVNAGLPLTAVVPIANLPYTLTSDAGHLLCGEQHVNGVGALPTMSEHPFAGCYWDTPEGRVFSLRSREDGIDVGEVAKQYGGGGHKHASGFRVPFDQLAQFEP